MLQHLGSSWGFGALLKGLTSVVVLRVERALDTYNPCRTRDSNPWPSGFLFSSSTLHPFRPLLPQKIVKIIVKQIFFFKSGIIQVRKAQNNYFEHLCLWFLAGETTFPSSRIPHNIQEVTKNSESCLGRELKCIPLMSTLCWTPHLLVSLDKWINMNE